MDRRNDSLAFSRLDPLSRSQSVGEYESDPTPTVSPSILSEQEELASIPLQPHGHGAPPEIGIVAFDGTQPQVTVVGGEVLVSDSFDAPHHHHVTKKKKYVKCCGLTVRRRVLAGVTFLVFVLGVIATLIVFADKIIDTLYTFLEKLDRKSPGTAVTFFFLTWVVELPFMAGYTLVGLSIGLVYGWPGAPILYVGGVSGSLVVFELTRVYVRKKQITYATMASAFRKYKKYVLAVEGAVNCHAFQVGTFLMLSFLPFGVTNALLSVTKITFWQFFAASMIGRLKLLFEIWIGSSGRDLIDVYKRGHQWAAPDIISFSVSVSFSIVALGVLAYYSRKWILHHHYLNEQATTTAAAAAAAMSSSESPNDTSINVTTGDTATFGDAPLLEGQPSSLSSSIVAPVPSATEGYTAPSFYPIQREVR